MAKLEVKTKAMEDINNVDPLMIKAKVLKIYSPLLRQVKLIIKFITLN